MKEQNLKTLSAGESQKMLADQRAELFQLRMKKKLEGVDVQKQMRVCRRLIAQLMTLHK